MTITICIPGLEKLADALMRMAEKDGMPESRREPATTATVAGTQMPAPGIPAQPPVAQQPGYQAPPVTPAVPTAPQAPSSIPQPAALAQQAAPQVQVPTSQKEYTLDELATAAMGLMDSGRQADLLGLLQSFGVEALPALPKGQYGAFATALRGMGAQI